MTDPLKNMGNAIWRQPSKTACPACKTEQDAFTNPYRNDPTARKPQTGDYAVCLDCGEVAWIDVHPLLGVSLREPTGPELARFSRRRANTRLVTGVHRFNANHPKRGGR